MFRNNPVWFVITILLIPVFGVGLLILIVWYISTKAQTLTVTSQDLLYERGILSKSRSELRLGSIRSVRVHQTLFQRIFGTGDIEIFTAGDSPEVTAKGNAGSERGPGAHRQEFVMAGGDGDRKLAIQIVSVIVAALLLAACAIFFFGGAVITEHFEPGVGLKSAAVFAFVLTLAAFVVLAIAAGDGLLGELQYMIAAFGGFFLVCWLMIA